MAAKVVVGWKSNWELHHQNPRKRDKREICVILNKSRAISVILLNTKSRSSLRLRMKMLEIFAVARRSCRSKDCRLVDEGKEE
ncbi:hypothetical protein SDJN03_23628, partial [Cucurbita argyrosperma subsp. sororia]